MPTLRCGTVCYVALRNFLKAMFNKVRTLRCATYAGNRALPVAFALRLVAHLFD